MAAAKSKPPKAKKGGKGIRGRMPTKRSINLVVVDENKVNPVAAVLGILVIVALAVAFSKFMVVDRLVAMSAATGRAASMKSTLDEAIAQQRGYGDVENTYAHYTMEGMTAAELGMVDRVEVLQLVGTILPPPDTYYMREEWADMFRPRPQISGASAEEEDAMAQLRKLPLVIPSWGYTINSWNVSGNLLTIDIVGKSLEQMNELAQQLEGQAIVDSSRITTANKRQQEVEDGSVSARIITYLRKPPEQAEEVTGS